MKINVYAEEYVDERRTKFVKKTTAQGTQFCGVSVFLKSHKDLHDSETDDDRSAITFWSYDRKDNRKALAALLREAAKRRDILAGDLMTP